MNLVLSGPIDDSLRNLVVALSQPRRVLPLHVRADRLEQVIDDAATRAQVATLCDAARVDHAYIEEGVRFADFKLLAMDMDSTLITIECIDEIADYAGKKAEVAAITEAAMRGEMDFAESLRRRVALLRGVHANILETVYATRLSIQEGARTLILAAKAARIHMLLVSGGFDFFANRLKLDLGFDEQHANRLEVEGGILTGKLIGTLVDAATKATVVKTAQARFSISPNQSMAIGDGANDIPMLNQVSFSIAYHAKPKTQAAARYHINFGGLSIVNDWLT